MAEIRELLCELVWVQLRKTSPQTYTSFVFLRCSGLAWFFWRHCFRCFGFSCFSSGSNRFKVKIPSQNINDRLQISDLIQRDLIRVRNCEEGKPSRKPLTPTKKQKDDHQSHRGDHYEIHHAASTSNDIQPAILEFLVLSKQQELIHQESTTQRAACEQPRVPKHLEDTRMLASQDGEHSRKGHQIDNPSNTSNRRRASPDIICCIKCQTHSGGPICHSLLTSQLR